MKNRPLKRRHTFGARSNSNADLEREFAAAADEISSEYRRRLSGIRRLTPQQRAAAVRAIKEWRMAAMNALRREFAAKRAAAKYRGAGMSAPPCRPPQLWRRRKMFLGRNPRYGAP